MVAGWFVGTFTLTDLEPKSIQGGGGGAVHKSLREDSPCDLSGLLSGSLENKGELMFRM
jgi:hypothetical protein